VLEMPGDRQGNRTLSRLSARVSDERSVKSLDILIAKLEDEKKERHIAELDIDTKTAPPR